MYLNANQLTGFRKNSKPISEFYTNPKLLSSYNKVFTNLGKYTGDPRVKIYVNVARNWVAVASNLQNKEMNLLWSKKPINNKLKEQLGRTRNSHQQLIELRKP